MKLNPWLNPWLNAWKLDRWTVLGNILVGYAYDCPRVPPGARIFTGAIVDGNSLTGKAITKSRLDPDKFLYLILLEPGTPEEHVGNPEIFQGHSLENTVQLNPGLT